MKLSVTSVILPDIDANETCELLSRLGYDGVEWRVRDTTPEAAAKPYSMWGKHKTDLSPANLIHRAAELVRTTKEFGLEIAAIASNLRANEYECIRTLAEGVAAIGAIPVRLDAPVRYDRSTPYQAVFSEVVDAYGKAIEILQEFGLKALVEIHGGQIVVSASLAYRLVKNFDSDQIGVIYDVNNMAKDGFETFRIGLELLGPYLAHCHAGGWRPEAGERRDDGTLDWEYTGCDLSDSILDIPLFIDDLRHVGYEGFISIEDFRQIPHEEKLQKQISYLRNLTDR